MPETSGNYEDTPFRIKDAKVQPNVTKHGANPYQIYKQMATNMTPRSGNSGREGSGNQRKKHFNNYYQDEMFEGGGSISDPVGPGLSARVKKKKKKKAGAAPDKRRLGH